MLVNRILRRYAEQLLSKIYLFQGIGETLPLADEVLLLRALAPSSGLTFFDVGANKGKYAEAVLEHFPADTQVHCFEPSKQTYASLHHLEGRVIANNIGLSDKCCTAQLFFDEPGSGMASLVKRRLDHFGISFGAEEEILLTTLEAYCEEKNVSCIDVLKLDVEGHELAVLEGGRQLFEQGRIGLVQFEFGGCNIDTKTSLQDFYYFFKAFDFNIYRMCRGRKLYPLDGYREIYELPVYQNFVAAKQKLV